VSDLPEDIRALLVCPRCRGPLSDEETALRCDACLLRYPVHNGIPVLLIDAAEPVSPAGG